MQIQEIKKIIQGALNEDLDRNGDITSNLIIPEDKQIKFQISNREETVLCGVDLALMVFKAGEEKFKKKLKITKKFSDGKLLEKSSVIIYGSGNARLILACERVALNLLQHLSGIATTTNKFVQELANNKSIQILDSRKTLPLLRTLQKYAVKVGGGKNHRFGLYDGILIKDNHIEAAGGVKKAINLVKKNLKNKIPIEIECDNLKQVKAAIDAGVDIIMLDNMNLNQLKQAVKIINKNAKIEVSGGITLSKIKAISKLEVDYISIGSLTHSVKASDIGLDLI